MVVSGGVQITYEDVLALVLAVGVPTEGGKILPDGAVKRAS
jgi:hypothetical protein